VSLLLSRPGHRSDRELKPVGEPVTEIIGVEGSGPQSIAVFLPRSPAIGADSRRYFECMVARKEADDIDCSKFRKSVIVRRPICNVPGIVAVERRLHRRARLSKLGGVNLVRF
jgi:hypothetical protein